MSPTLESFFMRSQASPLIHNELNPLKKASDVTHVRDLAMRILDSRIQEAARAQADASEFTTLPPLRQLSRLVIAVRAQRDADIGKHCSWDVARWLTLACSLDVDTAARDLGRMGCWRH
jgi:hypothetical protein